MSKAFFPPLALHGEVADPEAPVTLKVERGQRDEPCSHGRSRSGCVICHTVMMRPNQAP